MPRYRIYRTTVVTNSWQMEVEAESPEAAARASLEVQEDEALDNPIYNQWSTSVGGHESAEVLAVDDVALAEADRVKVVE